MESRSEDETLSMTARQLRPVSEMVASARPIMSEQQRVLRQQAYTIRQQQDALMAQYGGVVDYQALEQALLESVRTGIVSPAQISTIGTSLGYVRAADATQDEKDLRRIRQQLEDLQRAAPRLPVVAQAPRRQATTPGTPWGPLFSTEEEEFVRRARRAPQPVSDFVAEQLNERRTSAFFSEEQRRMLQEQERLRTDPPQAASVRGYPSTPEDWLGMLYGTFDEMRRATIGGWSSPPPPPKPKIQMTTLRDGSKGAFCEDCSVFLKIDTFCNHLRELAGMPLTGTPEPPSISNTQVNIDLS